MYGNFVFNPFHIDSDLNISDGFTKPLSQTKYEKFRSEIGSACEN